ncbi:MAG TPA: TRAP transporter small permease [Bacteroidota bacterium]|nr:TRAP transporter small permease [Bacteroidota bacterium]
MKFIRGTTRFLGQVERWTLVVLLLALVFLSFLQVVLRNGFSFAFLWTEPLLRYIVMWVGFLGAAVATREEKHFAVEFLGRFFPARAAGILRCLISLIAAAVVLILAYAALQFVTEGIDAGEPGLFHLPKRFFYAILPGSFGLIALHFLLRAAEHAGTALGKDAGTEGGETA